MSAIGKRAAFFAAVFFWMGACATGSGRQSVMEHMDETYVRRGDQAMLADVFSPESPGLHPAVLLLHSGSWRHGSKARMSDVGRQFAREGITAVAVNYRLTTEAQYPAQINDVRDALRWMRENHQRLGIRPDAIGILGYSAGGHLALLAGLSASEHRREGADVQAVAVAGAPADLNHLVSNPAVYALLGGGKSAKHFAYQFASPVNYATPDDPPVLLMHGKYDMIVPEAQAREMAERLGAAGVQVEFRELPHGHIRTTMGFNFPEVSAAIRFFKENLREARTTASNADQS